MDARKIIDPKPRTQKEIFQRDTMRLKPMFHQYFLTPNPYIEFQHCTKCNKVVHGGVKIDGTLFCNSCYINK